MNLKTCLVFVICSVTIVFTGCQKSAKEKVIKLAHGLDVNHTVHKAMEYMAERLAAKSDNTVRIKIYPNQQLGTERECLELLQIGSLGMTKVSAGVLENFAPSMKIFGLPFLFRDREHGYQVLDGEIGRQLLDDGEKYWLKGVAFYDAGSRSFYTKERPVYHPDDLKGLKIRVMESVTAIQMVKAFGGSPTPISWGELYTALQQGIVDGAENNPPSFYLSHHYEVCKYYILDEHTLLPDVLIISTIVWDSLNEQEKEWLMQAAQESVTYQRELWKEAEKLALEEVEKAGVTIIHPDREIFQEYVKPIYEEYESDPVLSSVIEKVKSLDNEEKN